MKKAVTTVGIVIGAVILVRILFVMVRFTFGLLGIVLIVLLAGLLIARARSGGRSDRPPGNPDNIVWESTEFEDKTEE